jgi:6-phosphogluconate dehydrogenase
MVHNGIEYGLMQAYAEGYELLTASDAVEDVSGVIRSWTQGTVIRSWLLDLLVLALDEDPRLEGIKGYVSDSGEGRWTVDEAINHSVPMPVIAAALFARFASRQEDSPAMKAVAALRNQFGGHAVALAAPDTVAAGSPDAARSSSVPGAQSGSGPGSASGPSSASAGDGSAGDGSGGAAPASGTGSDGG